MSENSLLIGLRGILPQRPHAAEGIAADEVIGFELDHGRRDHIQKGFDACSLPVLRRCFFALFAKWIPPLLANNDPTVTVEVLELFRRHVLFEINPQHLLRSCSVARRVVKPLSLMFCSMRER